MLPIAPNTGGLRRFLDGFAEALLDRDAAVSDRFAGRPDLACLVAQPGFAVYRNTVLKGCVDALQANYPAVARLVGDDWFRAAALVYARSNLPGHPTLLDYGAGFADFLAGFEPARAVPYLAAMARLDRLWTEAHIARDERPVEPAAVARLKPAALGPAMLRPHASARWAWSNQHPIFTLWDRNRTRIACAGDEHDDPPSLAWHGEGILIVRPRSTVQWLALDRAGCALLDACADGRTLADAANAALAADETVDIAALFSRLLGAGAFGLLALHPSHPRDLP